MLVDSLRPWIFVSLTGIEKVVLQAAGLRFPASNEIVISGCRYAPNCSLSRHGLRERAPDNARARLGNLCHIVCTTLFIPFPSPTSFSSPRGDRKKMHLAAQSRPRL